MRTALQVFLLMLLSVSGVSAQSRPDYPDVKSLVAAIQEQLKTINDYSMTMYATSTPYGDVVLDYRCVRPGNIRTEIEQGRHEGVVMVYLPQVKSKMVKIKAGNKRVWRNIDKLKLADTPMVESVLDKFSADLAVYPLTMKSHQKVVMDVGKAVKQTASTSDDSALYGDSSPSPAPVPTAHHETVEKTCYLLDGTQGTRHIQVLVDAATLWPVGFKRWDNGTLQFDTQVWHMAVNTAPKIDF